jgi:hypothetical protein
MKTYVQAQGFEVWNLVVDGYKEPTVPPTKDNRRKLSLNNSKYKNVLLNGLGYSIYVKFLHCSSTQIWDKLQNVYEGDAKVKEENLQTSRSQFEQLKMKEDENIVSYLLQVDETVNAIRGLGEEVDESIIVQKVLRSLPMRFDPNILAPEERKYLDSISMDELHGIFRAYEMRTK